MFMTIDMVVASVMGRFVGEPGQVLRAVNASKANVSRKITQMEELEGIISV